MEYQATGQIPGKIGSASSLFAPYQAFKAKDGYINVIGTGGKDHWDRFCKALGHEEWIKIPHFADNPSRIANLSELNQMIEEVLSSATVDEWVSRLTSFGLACDPLQTIDRMMEDPQLFAREMIVEKEHPIAGMLKFTGIPIKFSETPCKIVQLPPEKGEHTKDILRSIGYTPDEIEDLEKNKII